ncbi:hypothetical protein FCIRC_3337 [Fusarium circinatum]|uniref:Uncharacterized protein n=1 Tax=Fusarium circinatum TaxID=48490 RepID=A0A8H5U832_FUSCI|nr:hypothetical protein FCIRC_3337 [Fusarium circinatum]
MSDRVSKQYSRKSRQSREVDKELERIRKEREITALANSEKKLENDEDEASEDLFRLYEEMAALQSCLAVAAGRLSRIRKIKSKCYVEDFVEPDLWSDVFEI